MGYEPNFPANQLGGQKFLWVIVEYGLSGIWVRRESTVARSLVSGIGQGELPRGAALTL